MNSRIWRLSTAALAVSLLAAPVSARGYALLSLGTIDILGNEVESDSFDSADPAHSTNGLYPFGNLSKAKDNGDFMAGTLVNVATARIKGFLRLPLPSMASIGPLGSVGAKAWVEQGNLGIQMGHLVSESGPFVRDVTFPITSWIPVTAGNYLIDGASYKFNFTTSGDYTIPSVSGGIFIGTNVQVRLKITGSVSLTGNNDRIRIAEGGSLQIFMTGDSFSLAGVGLVNDTGHAQAFKYFGLPTNTSVTFLSPTPFIGAIFAPEAVLTVGGGGSNAYDFIGTAAAHSIRVNGHFSFHFDEDLFRSGPVPPFIATNLAMQTVTIGQTAVFKVAALGPSLSYRWQFAGVDIPGATTNSLTVTNVQFANAGFYSVIVTNSYGGQSSTARLSIHAAPVVPPDFLWARSATNGVTGTPFSAALSLAVDALGRPVAAGTFSAPQIDFGQAILTNSPDEANFICKYDASGNFVWARKAGASPGAPSPVRIAGDAAGNSWLAAHFIGTAVLGGVSLTNGGTADMFIAKYDALGTVLWARQIGAYDANYGNPFGLTVDTAGNCFISSRYQGVANLGTLSVSNGTAFLAKYDSAGTLVWALEGPEANAIIVGTNGAIYATGNGFLAKYDGQGSLVWSNAFPNGRAIALDGAQNLLVTGNGAPGSYGEFTLTNTGGFTDLFVAKCDPSGAVLWLRQAGSVKQQAGLGIARDEFNNVYVTAASATKNTDPSLTFGAVTLSNVMSFVAKYDAAGNGLWAKALGTTNWAVGWGIGVAPAEKVYLCGSFQGTATLGNFVLAEDPPSIGSAFVANLDGSEPRPMLTLAKAGNQVQLDLTGGAGFRYAVQTSSNLLDWSGVTTNVAPFGFLDDGGVLARFYRAVFVP